MIMGLALALTMSGAEAPQSPLPGTWHGHVRLRYEHVAQDSLALDADGLTARLRLGWQVPVNPSLEFLVEGEAVGAPIHGYNDTIRDRRIARSFLTLRLWSSTGCSCGGMRDPR